MQIVVAQPLRTSADPFAEVFQSLGCLKRYLIWARTLPPWLKPELARSSVALGGLRTVGRVLLPPKAGESWEYRLYPLFGRWAARRIEHGDSVFSSYGYCNEAFAKARQSGGVTMYNAGNSHPQYFWDICRDEHQRWGVRADPILRSQYERALAMVGLTDYFFCASAFVRQSYLKHGVAENRLITASRTFNPAVFKPAPGPRRDKTFRVVCPGTVSLRKGTVYLAQAFEKLRREIKGSELVLTRPVREDCVKVLKPYDKLITWIDSLPHPDLARLFQNSDVYVLASLEEGLAGTGLQAMACGLPVIVTPHTGVNDYVEDGVSGCLVPIRDPEAIYQKLLLLATQPDLRLAMGRAAVAAMERLRPERFAETVAAGIKRIEDCR